ncbi:MAG: calcium/sodium antiporter [Nanoarchaeota archaeon]|nr:calcium/sodium antiporter [Nanoarchaeota archaeon]
MILTLLILFASLVILLRSSELLIDSAVSIAKFYGVTEFFIGTTIIAFGTSLPELASSLTAAFSGHTGIILGNIVGSNITNVTLILGIASIMTVMKIKKDYFKNKISVLIGIAILFFVASLDGKVSAIEGLLFLVIFVWYIIKEKKETPVMIETKAKRLLDELFGNKKNPKILTDEEIRIIKDLDHKTYRELLSKNADLKKMFGENKFKKAVNLFSISLISIVGLVIGAKYLVNSAINIAGILNINEELIGLSLIALGTSMPELAVTFTSVKKGLPNILIGNIIGSNVANILLVGGLTSIITPIIITPFSLWLAIPFMILTTIMFRNYVKTKWISRALEGIILLFFYATFLFFLALSTGV